MQLVVEISLYPLAEQYITPIQTFIDRLNDYPQLSVRTSATSTLVKGDYAEVMAVLGDEMHKHMPKWGRRYLCVSFSMVTTLILRTKVTINNKIELSSMFH